METDFKGVWIPKEIWYNKEFSVLDKFIFTEISNLDNPKTHCYASNAYLAELCQCSERKISDSVNKLIKLGYIKVESFNGRNRVLSVTTKDLEVALENRKKCESQGMSSTIEDSAMETSKICESESHFLRTNNIDNNIKNNIVNIYTSDTGEKPKNGDDVLGKNKTKPFPPTPLPLNSPENDFADLGKPKKRTRKYVAEKHTDNLYSCLETIQDENLKDHWKSYIQARLEKYGNLSVTNLKAFMESVRLSMKDAGILCTAENEIRVLLKATSGNVWTTCDKVFIQNLFRSSGDNKHKHTNRNNCEIHNVVYASEEDREARLGKLKNRRTV